MSYRITLDQPPVVECDTAEEVFALAELAMERRGPDTYIAADKPVDHEEPAPVLRVKRAPAKRIAATPGRTAATPGTRAPHRQKGSTSVIRDYLKQAGCAKRVGQISAACDIPEDAVRATLDSPWFEKMDRGYYRLASSPTEPANSPDDSDDFEDPEPPKVQSKSQERRAVAQSKGTPPDLAEKIRRALAKEGAIAIPTIALYVDASGLEVKETLRNRPDMFRLNPRGGGWELRRDED